MRAWKWFIKWILMTFNWCNLFVLNWAARLQSRYPTWFMTAWFQPTPLSSIHQPLYFPLLIRSMLTRMIINWDISMHSPTLQMREFWKKEGSISQGSGLFVVGSICMENEFNCVYSKQPNNGVSVSTRCVKELACLSKGCIQFGIRSSPLRLRIIYYTHHMSKPSWL